MMIFFFQYKINNNFTYCIHNNNVQMIFISSPFSFLLLLYLYFIIYLFDYLYFYLRRHQSINQQKKINLVFFQLLLFVFLTEKWGSSCATVMEVPKREKVVMMWRRQRKGLDPFISLHSSSLILDLLYFFFVVVLFSFIHLFIILYYYLLLLLL